MATEKRLIEIPNDGIVKIPIMMGADTVGEKVIDLSHIPTVDAVEVVHGRWEPVDHDGSWRVDMCSVCHRRMHYVDYDQPYQYCPNCGADMRGDGNEI